MFGIHDDELRRSSKSAAANDAVIRKKMVSDEKTAWRSFCPAIDQNILGRSQSVTDGFRIEFSIERRLIRGLRASQIVAARYRVGPVRS